MVKIKTPKKTESAAHRSKRISANMFSGSEMADFLDFVRDGYMLTLTSRQAARFEHNRLRDTAIISLFLGSGLRVDEVAGLLLPDLDLVHGDVHALRKGSKLDVVSIINTAILDLKNYLAARETLYKPDKKNQFVFLTKYAGKANGISVEAIEKLVKKYTEAFLDGKRLSPHKLRHSFAKGFLDQGGSLLSHCAISLATSPLRPLLFILIIVRKSSELF